MKKLIIGILILSTISLIGCGSEKTYIIQSDNTNSSATTEKPKKLK